ncbi:unnamed protein product [Leptosia nina]|uniref:Endonuclease/exonuclease/phosphatase domain-containing protein n=1 Tax=Leptosia nina TaxID=320188 RepID=A0AAV1JD64_9NEOP
MRGTSEGGSSRIQVAETYYSLYVSRVKKSVCEADIVDHITNKGETSLKRSIEQVRMLCEYTDIIALQETWLLPHDLDFVSSISDNFASCAKSSVDTTLGVLRGRPYGGLAILWRRSVFKDVKIIDCSTDRLAAVRINCAGKQFLVMNVYMPTNKEENLIDFTTCLAQITAIIDECDTEAVYVLGDFNADPQQLFGRELTNFCNDNQLHCIDQDLLGCDSGTYTYISDAYGTRSWLDHCVVTTAARDSVLSAKVEYGVYWSDHMPLSIVCDISVIVIKDCLVNNYMLSEFNQVTWGTRTTEQIELYSRLCDRNLTNLKYISPVCIQCDNRICANHLYLIDKFYDDIVKILRDAAIDSAVCCRRMHKKPILGWNHYVKNSFRNARNNFAKWVLAGKPVQGKWYDNMKSSKRTFKNKLKWCQNHEEEIKMNVLAMHKYNKNFVKFWNSTKKINGVTKLPTNINNEEDPLLIANTFASHFRVSPLPIPSPAIKIDGSRVCVGDDDRLISPETIALIIKQMSRGKSPGFDGLSLEHILFAGKEIFSKLRLEEVRTMCPRYI